MSGNPPPILPMSRPPLSPWALRPALATSLALAASAALAGAQGLTPLHPFPLTGDFYVSDAGTDSIWRFQDLNVDGDYNDFDEIRLFYDEDLGTITLGNNNGIAVDTDGAVYVSDSSSDIVMVLRDLDFDGNCHAPGEHAVFFDGGPGGNQSNVEMVSAANFDIDANGRMYIAVANTAAGDDMILVLDDVNGDGDANDVGEASVFYTIAPGGAVGDSIPQDVVVAPDGHLYYLETSSTGFLEKGVYRLDDADASGDIDPLTEAAPFFVPPALADTPFIWGLGVDADGTFYMADTGNDVIWRFRDENANDVIDAGEFVTYWDAPGSSLIWKCVPGSDGRLLVAESQAPDRVLLMRDDNGDDSIDPVTEVAEIYDDTIAAIAFSNPRSIAWARRPSLTSTPAPAIDSIANYITQSNPGDLIFSFYSTGAAATPIAIPGFGLFELDLFAPSVAGNLYTGVVATSTFDVFQLSIPDNANLVGLTFFVQNVVGTPARAEFTNRVDQVFAP